VLRTSPGQIDIGPPSHWYGAEADANLHQDRLDHLDEKAGGEDAATNPGDLVCLWSDTSRSERRQHGRNHSTTSRRCRERPGGSREPRRPVPTRLPRPDRRMRPGPWWPTVEVVVPRIRATHPVDQRVCPADQAAAESRLRWQRWPPGRSSDECFRRYRDSSRLTPSP